MTDAIKLAIEPCPFCGHVGLDFREGSTFRWLAAECGGCGATCGETRVQTLGDGTKDEWMQQAQIDAIAVWNTRAALRAQPDHSELVKKLRRCRTSWPLLNTLLNEAAGALEGKL